MKTKQELIDTMIAADKDSDLIIDLDLLRARRKSDYEVYLEDGNTSVILKHDDRYHLIVCSNFTGRVGFGNVCVYRVYNDFVPAYQALISVIMTDNGDLADAYQEDLMKVLTDRA